MSEHSEEELLFHTLIVPLVLLMQLSSFILIPNPAVWGVKWIPGIVRLTKAALFPALKIKTSMYTGCSPSSAGLPKPSTHFCGRCADKAVRFWLWACHSRERTRRAGAWAGPLCQQPLPLAACSTRGSCCGASSESSGTASTAAHGNELTSLWGSGPVILQS